mgnify:CR=1 FL=1
MTVNKYCPIIILCFLSISSAQHSHGGHGKQIPKGCEIYGTVVDSISGNTIEYASISVIGSDQIIATGGVTNFEGKFEIEEIKPGIYTVEIEFMGFSPLIFSDIQLSFNFFPLVVRIPLPQVN